MWWPSGSHPTRRPHYRPRLEQLDPRLSPGDLLGVTGPLGPAAVLPAWDASPLTPGFTGPGVPAWGDCARGVAPGGVEQPPLPACPAEDRHARAPAELSSGRGGGAAAHPPGEAAPAVDGPAGAPPPWAQLDLQMEFDLSTDECSVTLPAERQVCNAFFLLNGRGSASPGDPAGWWRVEGLRIDLTPSEDSRDLSAAVSSLSGDPGVLRIGSTPHAIGRAELTFSEDQGVATLVVDLTPNGSPGAVTRFDRLTIRLSDVRSHAKGALFYPTSAVESVSAHHNIPRPDEVP